MSIRVPEEIERKADEICHNNADVEVAWATKCHMFAEEHEKLLAETPRNAMVELSGCDDELYKRFRLCFPKLDCGIINEEEMKSPAARRVWGPFCAGFERTIPDYNFGTLLRLDPQQGYSEQNTTLVPRVQFLCIEAARMREKKNWDVMAPEDASCNGKVFSLHRCRVCGKPAEKVCSRCKSARYCSVECQTRDWAAHKHDCHAQHLGFLNQVQMKK